MLERIAGCKFNHLTFVLPQQGTILGGNMNLHGNNLTLACFYGINFKAVFWALFTMEEPYISFSTESQDLVNDGEICVVAKAMIGQNSLNFRKAQKMVQLRCYQRIFYYTSIRYMAFSRYV